MAYPLSYSCLQALFEMMTNEPVCMICSFIDITDRKHIEEELRIKESAIASSINGIAIGDLLGNVTYINNAALDMWGTNDPADIIGKHATVFAQSEEEALQIIHTVLEKGHWSGEITGKKMDDSPITVIFPQAWFEMKKVSLSA